MGFVSAALRTTVLIWGRLAVTRAWRPPLMGVHQWCQWTKRGRSQMPTARRKSREHRMRGSIDVKTQGKATGQPARRPPVRTAVPSSFFRRRNQFFQARLGWTLVAKVASSRWVTHRALWANGQLEGPCFRASLLKRSHGLKAPQDNARQGDRRRVSSHAAKSAQYLSL